MDFWDYHGLWFLFGILFFPRITMVYFTSVTFEIWAALGCIFLPGILVAVYATVYYWHINPLLCAIAWVVAAIRSDWEIKIVVNAIRRMVT